MNHDITYQPLRDVVMANFKRRKPRSKTTGTTTAEVTRRKKLGITPLITPKHPGWDAPIQEKMAWRNIYYGESYIRRYSWASSYPAWWDRVFHNRPARAKSNQLIRLVMREIRDPDDLVWPDHRKPHIYYW